MSSVSYRCHRFPPVRPGSSKRTASVEPRPSGIKQPKEGRQKWRSGWVRHFYTGVSFRGSLDGSERHDFNRDGDQDLARPVLLLVPPQCSSLRHEHIIARQLTQSAPSRTAIWLNPPALVRLPGEPGLRLAPGVNFDVCTATSAWNAPAAAPHPIPFPKSGGANRRGPAGAVAFN